MFNQIGFPSLSVSNGPSLLQNSVESEMLASESVKVSKKREIVLGIDAIAIYDTADVSLVPALVVGGYK